MVAGVVMSGVGALMVPLAGGTLATTLAVLAFGGALDGLGGAVYNINALSLRQAITPDHLQGTINATMRFASCRPAPRRSALCWPACSVGRSACARCS